MTGLKSAQNLWLFKKYAYFLINLSRNWKALTAQGSVANRIPGPRDLSQPRGDMPWQVAMAHSRLSKMVCPDVVLPKVW